MSRVKRTMTVQKRFIGEEMGAEQGEITLKAFSMEKVMLQIME